MRWWPDSLLARLLLLLLGGLFLAQVAGGWILWQDRSRTTWQVVAAALVENLAGSIQELEAMAADERETHLTGQRPWPLRMSLDRAWREGPLDAPRAARRIERALEERLESVEPLQVWIEPPRRTQSGHGHHGHPGATMQRVVVQAGLSDGMVLTLHHPVPSGVLDGPRRLLLALGVFTLSVFIVAGLAVRGLVRPLRTLARAAEDLGHDLNRPPLPERGSREVRQAARAFNAMQQQLRRNLGERSRMLAAISHDLKTPITRMRLRTEMLPDPEQRQRFEADLAAMEHLVQTTLDYMRVEVVDEAAEVVELEPLLHQVVAEAREVGGDIALSETAPAFCRGHAMALRRCLGNLLDNAVRYGGRAEVVLEADESGTTIRIRDHGPGIPETEREQVFDPYFRLEPSRSDATGGTGLGLGIARNIARAHGGDVTLHNHPDGLEARLRLPPPSR